MTTRTISPASLDLRPLFALAILCTVALAPAPASSHTAASDANNSSLMAAVAEVPVVLTANSLNLVADQIIEVNYAMAYVLSAYVDLFSVEAIPQAAAAATAPAPQPVTVGESLALTLAYIPESLYETAAGTTDFLAAVEMAPIYVVTDALSDTLFKAGLY